MKFLVNIVLFAMLSTLLACTNEEEKSAHELHSGFLSAISLASETELVIEQAQEGRLTSTFRKSHFRELRMEAARQTNDVEQAHVDTESLPKAELCKAQLER